MFWGDQARDVMNRIGAIVMAAALVVALAGIPLGAASAFADGEEPTDESNESIAPGERLSGVLAVQNAEFDGEVTERSYGVKIAGAATDEARADVVNDTVVDVEDRLDELEERLDELEADREADELTDGQYRAQVAKVAAERATAERLAENAEATAGELPEDVLAERGIDVAAIAELRERASELGGPETAELARSIAGDRVGGPVAGDRTPGAPAGTPGGPPNETAAGDRLDRADAAIDRAVDEIDRAESAVGGDEGATDALAEAESSLTEAEDALERAEDAGNESTADGSAEEAIDRATEAIEYAEEAVDRADGDRTDDADGDRTDDADGDRTDDADGTEDGVNERP